MSKTIEQARKADRKSDRPVRRRPRRSAEETRRDILAKAEELFRERGFNAVAIADISMSLDNVLAVAGAAREHPGILIVGLVFAVALMGIAANFIARYIERYRWIGYVGLLVILWVALKMIWDGYHDVAPVLGWPAVVVPA